MILHIEVPIRFKEGQPDCSEEMFEYIHPEIHHMVVIVALIAHFTGHILEVTSMVRPHTPDQKIHHTGRALDAVFRPVNAKFKFYTDFAGKIAAIICGTFRRPTTRPSCIYHNAGSGWHFHFQCDPGPGWVDLDGKLPEKADPTAPQP